MHIWCHSAMLRQTPKLNSSVIDLHKSIVRDNWIANIRFGSCCANVACLPSFSHGRQIHRRQFISGGFWLKVIWTIFVNITRTWSYVNKCIKPWIYLQCVAFKLLGFMGIIFTHSWIDHKIIKSYISHLSVLLKMFMSSSN